jgi:glyoxylase-like metal-dependent hydrolase (beta-lactamase superfamily II)
MKIDRRQFLAVSSGAAAVPFTRMFAQTPAAPPVAAVTPPVTAFSNVRRNVGIFTGRGGTIGWLVNPDAVVAVDTQFADTAKICVEGLKQKAGGRAIDTVFNTHHHGDHTGGNAVFRAESKRLIAHQNVPDLMRKVAGAAPNAPAPTVPDTTFDKTWSQRFGDETIAASFNGPGHTGGDAIIRFERANVAHMGDLLFHERHPRVDRAGGASIQNWITILEKAAKDFPADTIYIAGHSKEGSPVTVDRKAVLQFRDYFTAVLGATRKAISAGQTKDVLIATPSLPGFEQYQGSGTLTLAGVLGVAFDELSAK